MNSAAKSIDYDILARRIKAWGKALGFQRIGIADTVLPQSEQRLLEWLQNGRHGEMEYMSRHGIKRSRPEVLLPGTLRVISTGMDYLPAAGEAPETLLADSSLGYISRYALGRDYHKLIRKRLVQLAEKIRKEVGVFGCRPFVDSAPVLEKPLAQKAGLGWMGKHTNLIDRDGGSWFFLGELYTDLPLPPDRAATNHCGRCNACLEICPTGAITAPYQLDARRCISYLTIELPGPIPLQLRPLMGNRIYGCDDCQLACPWNRFAKASPEPDFLPREGLDAPRLIELFGWSEEEFLRRMEGSPIRRIGYQRWLRNLAVAMGNGAPRPETLEALKSRSSHDSELVREHVRWALARLSA